MSFSKLVRRIYLGYLSQPPADRRLYRIIGRRRVRSIVEIGVGMGERASRMIRLAVSCHGQAGVNYTGVDLFEARPSDRPGMTLKRAHRVLGPLGAKVQLTPGDPCSALARIANTLRNVDLLVVGEDQDRSSLDRAWFYVPRMLHADSLVLWEEYDAPSRGAKYRLVERSELDQLASQAGRGQRRAA